MCNLKQKDAILYTASTHYILLRSILYLQRGWLVNNYPNRGKEVDNKRPRFPLSARRISIKHGINHAFYNI